MSSIFPMCSLRFRHKNIVSCRRHHISLYTLRILLCFLCENRIQPLRREVCPCWFFEGYTEVSLWWEFVRKWDNAAVTKGLLGQERREDFSGCQIKSGEHLDSREPFSRLRTRVWWCQTPKMDLKYISKMKSVTQDLWFYDTICFTVPVGKFDWFNLVLLVVVLSLVESLDLRAATMTFSSLFMIIFKIWS